MGEAEGNTAAIVGCGTIGRNWALIFLRAGWSVRVFDPDPDAEANLRSAFEQLRQSVPEFSSRPFEALSFHKKLSGAVHGARWVQEGAPDRLELKHKLYQLIRCISSPDALIASSSRTLAAIDIQTSTNRSRDLLIVRPKLENFSSSQVTISGAPTTPEALLVSVSDFLATFGLEPEIQFA